MIAPGSAFFDRARSVAEAFLQSAVIVDDHIELQPAEAVVVDTLEVEEKVLVSEDVPATHAGASKLTLPHSPLNGKALVGAFAEKGIVCGLMRPDQEELDNLPSALRSVLLAADVAIIDWFLDSSTEHARALIASIVRDAMSSEPNRPRYIVVYSGNPRVETIAAQLGEAIKEAAPQYKVDIEDFRVACGGCRVVVFAKAEALVGSGFGDRVVDERELVARIVADFAQEYCGLVSNVALASITAVRRNTHRILGRMSRDLDGAFLTHRALSEAPAQAQEDLRHIVVEEMEAVLEDEGVCSGADTDAIRDWIDARELLSKPLVLRFGAKQVPVPVNSTDDLVRLLTDGVSEYIEGCGNLASKHSASRNPEQTDMSSVLGYASSLDFPDERFAALHTLQPRYTDEAPTLTLGTIVKRKARKGFEFLVCVQPRCDAVLRKGDARPFLFLPLEQAGDHGFCTVVPDGNRFARLLRSRDPYRLQTLTFGLTSAGDTAIRARSDKTGFYFESSRPKRRLRWCGQLKDAHAQDVAQRMASKLARVGHNTSAWLRMSTHSQVRDQ